MQILLVGLNHRSAPLEVRESLSFSPEQLPRALPLLKEVAGECAIQSTCNRTDLYAVSEDPARTARDIVAFVSEFHGLDSQAISPYLYNYAWLAS